MKTAVIVVLLAFCAMAMAAPSERVFATDGCLEKKPKPPTDLAATPKSDNTIVVAWNSPNGDACVDSYTYVLVEKGKPEPRMAQKPEVKEYSLTFDNLKPNTAYEVKVAAVNSQKGTSEFAVVAVKTDKKCQNKKPGSIGNVYVNEQSNSVALLSWLPPTEGGCTTDYEILGENKKTGAKVANINTINPRTKATGLTAGQTYYFRITPSNKNGKGPTKRIEYKMSPFKPPVVASGSIPAGRRLKAE